MAQGIPTVCWQCYTLTCCVLPTTLYRRNKWHQATFEQHDTKQDPEVHCTARLLRIAVTAKCHDSHSVSTHELSKPVPSALLQKSKYYHLQDRQKISQFDSFQLQINRKTIFKGFHSNQMYFEHAPLSFPDGEHILVDLRELCVPKKSGHWKRRELSPSQRSGLRRWPDRLRKASAVLTLRTGLDCSKRGSSSSSYSLLSVKLIGWNQRLNKVLKTISVTLHLHARADRCGRVGIEIFCPLLT